MIIGTKEISLDKLKEACRTTAELEKFACELVPTPLRHIPEITANQKYYVALFVRSIASFAWARKHELCESLLKDVRIKGVPDVVYDYQDILLAIDTEAFERYLREERDAKR